MQQLFFFFFLLLFFLFFFLLLCVTSVCFGAMSCQMFFFQTQCDFHMLNRTYIHRDSHAHSTVIVKFVWRQLGWFRLTFLQSVVRRVEWRLHGLCLDLCCVWSLKTLRTIRVYRSGSHSYVTRNKIVPYAVNIINKLQDTICGLFFSYVIVLNHSDRTVSWRYRTF